MGLNFDGSQQTFLLNVQTAVLKSQTTAAKKNMDHTQLFPEDKLFGKALKLHTDAMWKLLKGFPKETPWDELSGWLIDLSRVVSIRYLQATKILLFPVQIRE